MATSLFKEKDGFFRIAFSDPQAQRDLVRICAPRAAEMVDLTTLQPVDASFTGGSAADLLLKAKDRFGDVAYIYLLVEHKSSPERTVALQLLGYVHEILRRVWKSPRKGRRRRTEPLPYVHPVVIYDGQRPWRVPTRIVGCYVFV